MSDEIKTTFSAIDRLFYLYRNDQEIHHQLTPPSQQDKIDAVHSDNWKERFKDIEEGKRVRISTRIYYAMLEAVPPLEQKPNSFYCGECYADKLYFYFERVNNLYFGCLKELPSSKTLFFN